MSEKTLGVRAYLMHGPRSTSAIIATIKTDFDDWIQNQVVSFVIPRISSHVLKNLPLRRGGRGGGLPAACRAGAPGRGGASHGQLFRGCLHEGAGAGDGGVGGLPGQQRRVDLAGGWRQIQKGKWGSRVWRAELSEPREPAAQPNADIRLTR